MQYNVLRFNPLAVILFYRITLLACFRRSYFRAAPSLCGISGVGEEDTSALSSMQLKCVNSLSGTVIVVAVLLCSTKVARIFCSKYRCWSPISRFSRCSNAESTVKGSGSLLPAGRKRSRNRKNAESKSNQNTSDLKSSGWRVISLPSTHEKKSSSLSGTHNATTISPRNDKLRDIRWSFSFSHTHCKFKNNLELFLEGTSTTSTSVTNRTFIDIIEVIRT